MSHGDPPIRVQLLFDGSIAVTGQSSTLVFSRVWAGVGWPEAEQGALCVLAESLEGVYHALAEWRGSLYDLGSAASSAWADLLVDSFWIDASDEVSTTYFRRLDFSLSGVKEVEAHCSSLKRPLGRPAGANGAVGPAIVGVRPTFRENFRASLETMRGISASERLAVHQDRCPSLAFALKRDLDYLLRSPVVKALVWALTAMESTRGQAAVQVGPDDVWYHNVHR